MESKFGQTEGFYGYKVCRNHLEIFIRPLTKTIRNCRLPSYYKSVILLWKFSFASCKCPGRDVIELCYNSEAGLSFKKQVTNQVVISQNPLFIFNIMESLLIMFRKVVDDFCQNYLKHMNEQWAKCRVLLTLQTVRFPPCFKGMSNLYQL